MMNGIFSRSELLWGEEFQKELAHKKVTIFGVGGVGSYACEAITRSGVGNLTIVDFDEISKSNINRQLPALHSTIGKKKTQVMKERVLDINPNAKIKIINSFYSKELNQETLLIDKPDFVVDAIDTIRSKIELLEICHNEQIQIISSLGAGNRLYPEKLDIVDLKDIKNKKCTFTKNVLYQLNKRDINEGIPFVVSEEPPAKIKKIEVIENTGNKEFKKITPASVAFVPPAAGLIMAGYVVRSFLNDR